MSKRSLLVLYPIFLIPFLLIIIFILPKSVYAQTISPIGSLKMGEQRLVTISELNPDTLYYWKASRKLEGLIYSSYETIPGDCFTSSSGDLGEGKHEQNIGPINITGKYKLEIYKSLFNDECRPERIPIVSQEFTVGTLDPNETGTCQWAPDPPLHLDKNNCKTGYTPTQEGSYVFPTCTCRPSGAPGEIPKEALPVTEKCKNKDDPTLHEGDKLCTLAGGIPCDTTDPKNPGINTAIGCIHTSPVGLIKDFLKFIIGISGGLAFLMMLLGAFQMLTSAGNPETLQAGRERLTSAIIGLLFVIFAVLLLQIIGVDILKIPGFGR